MIDTINDLKNKINYLENKIKCCSYDKEDLYELKELKEKLYKLESEE